MDVYLLFGLVFTCVFLLVRRPNDKVDPALILMAILLWPLIVVKIGWDMFQDLECQTSDDE